MFVLVLAGGFGLRMPVAAAATATVTLGPQGPSPTTVTVAEGDTVRFVNSDSVTHTLTHTSGPWSFTATVAAGGHQDPPAFTASGTFSYSDRRNFVVPTTASGSIVVRTKAPSPTPGPGVTSGPTAAPRPSASQKPSGTPKPSATAGPSATLPSSAQPSLSGGPGASPAPAALPSVPGTGQVPPAGQSGTPKPTVAVSAAPSPSGTPAPWVSYAERGLTQGSSHRYGLPAALAVVAIMGLASLLLRLLMAEPAARRRRTGLEASRES